MKRAPSLNSLRAFEAAARLGSIAAAAAELHVTPAAISHQIKAAEGDLQILLFVRAHSAITLTPAGSQYFADVTRHLTGLQRATERLMRVHERTNLRMHVHATIALRWLIPRLSSFQSAHPDVTVKLTTSLQSLSFNEEEFDCAIQLGLGQWKGLRSHAIVRNELVPACTPAYARSVLTTRNEGSLARATLLHSLARTDDWACWLQAGGLEDIDAEQGLKYDSSVFAYQAALEGQGVAIAQKVLIEAELAAGSLVLPFERTVDMGAFTYYFVYPARRAETDELKHFKRWIIGTLLPSAAR